MKLVIAILIWIFMVTTKAGTKADQVESQYPLLELLIETRESESSLKRTRGLARAQYIGPGQGQMNSY